MSVLVLLNVLIGILFAWSLLSLATMNLQEWLTARLKWRARMLEASLEKLLTDPVLVVQFYSHPLIRALFTGKDSRDKPSYIPPGQFSQAMLDMLATTGTEASLYLQQLHRLNGLARKLGPYRRGKCQQRLNLMIGMTRKALVCESGEETISASLGQVKDELESLGHDFLRIRKAVQASLETIQLQKEQVGQALAKLAVEQDPSDDAAVNQVRAGVTALSITHPALKQSLFAILHSIPQSLWQKENELELLRQNLEAWFNNSMDRLTGWYKRRTQVTMFFISLLLAFLVNVDSVNLADRLWHEPDMRNTLLDKIGQLISQAGDDSAALNSSQIVTLQETLAAISLPIGWVGTPVDLPQAPQNTQTVFLPGQCTLMPVHANDVYGVMLSSQCYRIVNAPPPADMTGWFLKLLGFLITGFAASQGAPLWFDLLKKVVNVRWSGLRPTSAPSSVG